MDTPPLPPRPNETVFEWLLRLLERKREAIDTAQQHTIKPGNGYDLLPNDGPGAEAWDLYEAPCSRSLSCATCS